MAKLPTVCTAEFTVSLNSVVDIKGSVDTKCTLNRNRITVDDNTKASKIDDIDLIQIDRNECKNKNLCNNYINDNGNDDKQNGNYVDADDDDDEKDLTNLNWLTELRHQNLHWPNETIMDDECHNLTDLKSDMKSLKYLKSLDLDRTYNIANQFTRVCNQSTNDSVQTISTIFTDMNEPTDVAQEITLTNAHLHRNANEPKSKSYNNNLWNLENNNRTTEHSHNSSASSSKGICANFDIINKNSDNNKLLQQQLKRPTPTERYEIFINKIKRDLTEYGKSEFSYQTDTTAKPPFNYSHIIGMVMMEHGRVTLQQICSWIELKFAYYRVRKKWNNSIRHNLSLHYCFRKIDRNKYEKGKGGYWELGLDPKKCDRKRIRNRKNVNMTIKNKIHRQQLNDKSQQRVQSQKRKLTTNYLNNVKQFLLVECSNNGNKDIVHNYTEELYLDELDVQKNIDVSSCNQLQQHQKFHQKQHKQDDLCVTEISQDDDNAVTSTDQESQFHDQQQHQYQLGTIIISTKATADTAQASPTTVQENSDVPTFNCLIGEHIYNLQQQQNMGFENCSSTGVVSSIPTIYENVIISSYLNNATTQNDGDIYEKTTATILTQRPNVIVEQLIQPETLNVVGSAQLSNTFSNTNVHATSVNGRDHDGIPLTLISNYDYTDSNVLNDNFRPYIDGIEEAFQYLRSMDNNRSEDLLDNLYDISVSEY